MCVCVSVCLSVPLTKTLKIITSGNDTPSWNRASVKRIGSHKRQKRGNEEMFDIFLQGTLY